MGPLSSDWLHRFREHTKDPRTHLVCTAASGWGNLCILIIVGSPLINQLPRRERDPIHMASRTTSLQPDAPAQRYNTFIQSCFCRHPEAGSYYQQLIDFI